MSLVRKAVRREMQRSVGCNRSQADHLAVSILYVSKYSHRCILEVGNFKCINTGCVIPCGLRLRDPFLLLRCSECDLRE